MFLLHQDLKLFCLSFSSIASPLFVNQNIQNNYQRLSSFSGSFPAYTQTQFHHLRALAAFKLFLAPENGKPLIIQRAGGAERGVRAGNTEGVGLPPMRGRGRTPA